MTGIVVQQESIEGLWPELWPLLYAHWKEIAAWPDILLDPDREAYEALDEVGMLRIYTARDGVRLVGYAAYILREHLHYRSSMQAVQDVLFLDKDYRLGGLGMRLMKYADEELAKAGAQVIFHHTKVAHDFGPLLERMGYKLVEKVYARRIG